MTMDWMHWHDAYEDPESSLATRLALVQGHVRRALDACPSGPIRLISMCAGQGRDVISVLAEHPRRRDVRARLVELDPRNIAFARELARSLYPGGAHRLEIVEGDASISNAYAGATPADVVLACGIFGNISNADIANLIDFLPSLCSPRATVIWTRHRNPPDLTPTLRSWLRDRGFDEVAFDTPKAHPQLGVGVSRFTGTPRELEPGVQLFTFDPSLFPPELSNR